MNNRNTHFGAVKYLPIIAALASSVLFIRGASAQAVITIPAHWAGSTQIEFKLVDSSGNAYPGALTDNTEFLGGRQVVTVADAGGSITLPYNDEIPTPPGQTGSSFWQITVRDGRRPVNYRVAIASTSPITEWNELIGATDLVGSDSIFIGRLLPASPDDDDIAQYDLATDMWEAVPSAGGGADIDQHEVAARIASGTGAYSGLGAAEVTTEASPTSGMWSLGWDDSGQLRKYDLANFYVDGSAAITGIDGGNPTSSITPGILLAVDGGAP